MTREKKEFESTKCRPECSVRDFKSIIEPKNYSDIEISAIVSNINLLLDPKYIPQKSGSPEVLQNKRKEKLDIAIKFLESLSPRMKGTQDIKSQLGEWLEVIQGQAKQSRTDYAPNPSSVIGLLSLASEETAIEFLKNPNIQQKYPRIAAEVIKKRNSEFADKFLENHESIKDGDATIEALKKADPLKALKFILTGKDGSLLDTHPKELLKIGNKILRENKGIQGWLVEQWENFKLKLERTFTKTTIEDQYDTMRPKLQQKQSTKFQDREERSRSCASPRSR